MRELILGAAFIVAFVGGMFADYLYHASDLNKLKSLKDEHLRQGEEARKELKK
jgi:hypothetical protein